MSSWTFEEPEGDGRPEWWPTALDRRPWWWPAEIRRLRRLLARFRRR